MRSFSSYGLIDTNSNFYAPREELINKTMHQIIGDHTKGGYYITIWAPRQTGKSTLMHQVVQQIKQRNDFEVGMISLQSAKIEHVITKDRLNVKNLTKLYESYLHKNKNWLLKDAPRRKDLRIFEAVYHFSLYMYLHRFLIPKQGQVWPEFPTGNGKIDLLIKYANQLYGIELKSYTDESAYHDAIEKAAKYAVQLDIKKISLVFFVDVIDDSIREKYEIEHVTPDTGIKVEIVFIACEESNLSE